jgi:hypothetical protein
VGAVYTGGTKKIAEHGGANPGDRDVPLLVAGAVAERGVRDEQVETRRWPGWLSAGGGVPEK